MSFLKVFFSVLLATSSCVWADDKTTEASENIQQNREECYIRCIVDENAFIFTPEVLKKIDSKLIGQLLVGIDFKSVCKKIVSDGATVSLMEKIITLPSIIDQRSMRNLKEIIGELDYSYEYTSEKDQWGKVRELMHRFIEKSYQSSYLAPVVKLLNTLEILECSKLADMYREEIDVFKKEDRFRTYWNVAVKKTEAQKEPISVQETNRTASNTMRYEEVAHVPGLHAIWSGDGHRFAAMSDKINSGPAGSCHETRVYEAPTGKLLAVFDGFATSLSHDGSKLLTLCYKGRGDVGHVATIKLYDVSPARELCTYSGYMAQFSLDGSKILINAERVELQVFDANNLRPLHTIKIYEGQFSPNGCRAIARLTCTYIGMVDVATQKTIACTLGTSGTFSPDGCKVALGGKDETFSIFDTETGNQLGEFDGNVAAFSSDSSRLATVVAKDGDCKKPLSIIYDIATEKQLGTMPGDLQQFLPGNNDRALILTPSDEAEIYDLILGRSVYKLGKVRNARFSPDGSHLFVVDDAGIKILALRNE